MHYIAYVRRSRFYRDALTESIVGPVVIHDGKRVLEVCEAAQRLGVNPGFSFVEARTLARGATFVVTEPMDRWEEARRAWTGPLRRFTERIEVEAPNATYLDLTGHPDPYTLLDSIQASIPGPFRIGIGRAKWLARRAAFREGIHSDWVARPDRKLAPLPVRVLPFPPELTARLGFLGCRTIADVQALSLETLRNQFGELGREIELAALGLLTDELKPNEGPSCLRVFREVSEVIDDREGLNLLLRDVAIELAAGLTKVDASARVIRAWWDDGSVDHTSPKPLRAATPIQLALSRLIVPKSPITELVVELPLESARHFAQYSIADPRDPEAISDAVSRLKSTFGDSAIQCAGQVAVPRRVQVLKAWMRGAT